MADHADASHNGEFQSAEMVVADANDQIIDLALSLEGKDLTAQKEILVKLFGSEDLGCKRQYKALAFKLHPDKNKKREHEATRAMQFFLSAVDFHMRAHLSDGTSIMARMEVDRVKLGLRLLGQEVQLKDAGPWSSVPIRLVDFEEEPLRFAASRPSGSLWTGLLALHPGDAQAGQVVRLSSDEPFDGMARMRADRGKAYRLSRKLIEDLVGRLSLPQTFGSWRPFDFADFGTQRLLRQEELELRESHWLMFDAVFNNRLSSGASSTSVLHCVDAEVLEVVPSEVKQRLGLLAKNVDLALVQIVNPFEAKGSLSMGQISHDLVEAFVLRQRLGREQLDVLERMAREALLPPMNIQANSKESLGSEAGVAEHREGGKDSECMVLNVADGVDSLILAESKRSFISTLGAGILHQTEAKEATCWYSFTVPENAPASLRRLVGFGGIMRSGIKPAEMIQHICVHPRTNKLLQKTDEYFISLHARMYEDLGGAERERIDSKLLDDFIVKGVVKKIEQPPQSSSLPTSCGSMLGNSLEKAGQAVFAY